MNPITELPLAGSTRELARLYFWGRVATKVIATALALFFTFLQVKNAHFGDWLSYTSSQFFINLALIIFYFSFFFGPGADMGMQKEVFFVDPNRGRITIGFVAWVPLFVIVASVLLWASDKGEKYFAIALSVYFPVDALGWNNYVNWAKPIISASRTVYEEKRQYFEQEKLNFAGAYISWHWQKYRFAFMLCMIGIFDLICFSEPVRQIASAYIQPFISDASVETVYGIIPGAFYLLYVLTTELWMWLARFRARASIRVVDSLQQKYDFQPKT